MLFNDIAYEQQNEMASFSVYRHKRVRFYTLVNTYVKMPKHLAN